MKKERGERGMEKKRKKLTRKGEENGKKRVALHF